MYPVHTRHGSLLLPQTDMHHGALHTFQPDRYVESIFRKISLFCNVKPECVIENRTLQNLYEAPLMLEGSADLCDYYICVRLFAHTIHKFLNLICDMWNHLNCGTKWL